MHPKYKTKYRVGNWAEYDRALVRRGDVPVSDRLSIDGYQPRRLDGLDSREFTPILAALRRFIASHTITDLPLRSRERCLTAPGAGHEEPVLRWSRADTGFRNHVLRLVRENVPERYFQVEVTSGRVRPMRQSAGQLSPHGRTVTMLLPSGTSRRTAA